MSSEGVLVTQEGWPVQGEGGEIRVEGGRIGGPGGPAFSVGEDGTVRVNGREVGKLRIEDFPQSGSLVKPTRAISRRRAGAANRLRISASPRGTSRCPTSKPFRAWSR